MEYSRQELGNPEEQRAADAKGLIAKAAKLSALSGKPVDPATFIQRKTDFQDGQFEALKVAIAKEQGTINAAVVATAESTDAVEVDPRLKTFKADFDAVPALKSQISWAEIQTRLLANEGHYLALAQAMEQGGQLFGVDAKRRPLISDRGDEPIMKGMNYADTRDRVKYKHTSNDKNGTKIFDAKNQPIATGYEMFGYTGDCGKSDEINQYETYTGKHFVQSPGKKEWRSSWLESGEEPSWPRVVDSFPDRESSYVRYVNPYAGAAVRGVRRLLRVEKAA